MKTVTLYGSPLSLYTGRVRSYLIKNGISYREQEAQSEHFKNNVLPKAGGLRTIPIIETDDGDVVRDGAAIVSYFEEASGNTCSPTSPRQQIVSLLLDVIGAEGLLRPAMHYRWNFPEQNTEFVMHGFRNLFPPGPNQHELADGAAGRMQAACTAFGVSEQNKAFIEANYTALLDLLDVHFGNYPYLLGGRPSIGDFGLLAPMFAHLGRDPAPLSLMQSRAPRVYRWVERMNRPTADMSEFANQEPTFLADDQVPDSLIAVLKHMAIDFMPETLAAASCINQWIDEQESLDAGTPLQRGVGFASFSIGSTSFNALAQPYRFYLLAKFQSAFEELTDDERSRAQTLLNDCGMDDLLNCKLSRNIGRRNNLETWE